MSDTQNDDLTSTTLRHINYAVSSHGEFVGLIQLPKNVRVIMKCTYNTCVTSKEHEINFFKLMFDDFGNNLENMKFKYDVDNDMCVYDGNKNDQVPDVIFYRDHTSSFIDGIFKLPLNVEIISNNGSIIANNETIKDHLKKINTSRELSNTFALISSDTNAINYASVVLSKTYQRLSNARSNYLSEYIPFGNTNKITTLKKLIKYIKDKNEGDNIITIFVHACLTTTNAIYSNQISEFGIKLDKYLKPDFTPNPNASEFISNPRASKFIPNPYASEFIQVVIYIIRNILNIKQNT